MIRQTTRLPEHLHTWLADRAKANHRSLNAELISVLSAQSIEDDRGGYLAKVEPPAAWEGTQERGQ